MEQIDELLEKRVATLGQIDQKIMHWTMHHGQTFSDSSRIRRLETEVNKRFDRVDRKLDQLAATK